MFSVYIDNGKIIFWKRVTFEDVGVATLFEGVGVIRLKILTISLVTIKQKKSC